MQNRYPAIVSYDISDNKRRYHALKILKAWRLDGQKSVHECLLSAEEAQRLYTDLSRFIDEETDSLMLAWIPPNHTIFNRGTGHSMGFFAQFFDIQ